MNSRAEVWATFYAALVTPAGSDPMKCMAIADRMMAEFDKRFERRNDRWINKAFDGGNQQQT
jgi:hypothetical protein